MFSLIPVLSFLLCLAATPAVRSVAFKKGWIAQPSNQRWHTKPTALLGGVAIYLGLSVGVLPVADFVSILSFFFRQSDALNPPSIGAVIWLGMTFLFGIGLLDDIRPIKPRTKLAAQVLAALLVTLPGFRLHWFAYWPLDTLATLVWIVGITNAFNLLDNMDGLCAGMALIAAVMLASLCWNAMPEAALIALALAGSLTAFLVYNFNPASIFMGDCGSLIIGFCVSALSLCRSETQPEAGFTNIAVPVLLLLVPIFDTILVTVTRLRSGRKPYVGGRDHTSHRLVLMNFSEKGAVLFLYGIGCLVGFTALFVSRSDAFMAAVAVFLAAAAGLVMGICLARLPVYPEKKSIGSPPKSHKHRESEPPGKARARGLAK